MLAYESLEACQVDLTKYNLVLVEDAANSIGELYLDCKSCNLQNL
jgi:dTDP-4-amino-4,6-dideoxygalactose transaminase